MQTPKASSSGTPPKNNSPRSSEASRKNTIPTTPPKPAATLGAGEKASPRAVRQLKTGPRYLGHTASSTNLATKPPKERSPKVAADHKSPKSPACEKKQTNRVTNLDNQVSRLENELKLVKDQLCLAEKDAEESRFQQLSAPQKQQPEAEPEPEARSDNQENELDKLRQNLSETLSLVEHMKTQLVDSKASEMQAHTLAQETLSQLEVAKKTVEALRSDGLKATEAHDALAHELDHSRARVIFLEELVGKLEADKLELEQMKLAEVRHVEERAREAREAADKVRAEWAQREAHLESELKKSMYEVEELRANLMDKETELQGIWEENEGLAVRLDSMVSGQGEVELRRSLERSKGEIEELKARLAEKEAEWRAVMEKNERFRSEEKEGGDTVGEMEAARAAEREAVMKAAAAAVEARAEMEAEVRRMKVQSEQWRKAAEAAAAMISLENNNNNNNNNSNNGQVMERTGSMDSHFKSPRNWKSGSPYVDELDDDLMKTGNKMRRFGSLWKKQHK